VEGPQHGVFGDEQVMNSVVIASGMRPVDRLIDCPKNGQF
jgi:hypothetical protein